MVKGIASLFFVQMISGSTEPLATRLVTTVSHCLHDCRDVNRVNEEWFADTDGLRDKVGLLDEQPSGSGRRKVRSFMKRMLQHVGLARAEQA